MTNILSIVYQNFNLDNPTITATVLLWAMYAALLLANIVLLYNRAYVGETVRALIKHECNSEDSALTLEELGLKNSVLRRRTLRDSATLRKYVIVSNPDQCKSTKARSRIGRNLRRFFSMDTSDVAVYDFSSARLYLSEEKRYEADIRYGKRVKLGVGILSIVFTAVLGLVLVLVLMHFVPEVLKLLDDLITYVKNSFAND